MESINNLDEAGLLGYFETAKSVFLLKFLFLSSVTGKDDNGHFLELPNELKKSNPIP